MKKTIKILSLLCIVALLSCVLVVALADQPLWSEAAVEEEYAYGESFTVPERTVTVGGQSVTATHTVVYPDGSSTLKDSLSLNMSGVYTVCYQATVAGKPYMDEIQFLVKDYLYYFDTDKSSAVYEPGKGLLVELAEGDTIHFNAVVDMNTVTVNDILLEAFATPAEQGRFDFKRLYFTFTDVEDPARTLTFSARHSASSVDAPYTYAMVAGNGQILTGMEPWNGDVKKHVEGTSNFGLPFPHSFKDSTKGTILFRYDAPSMTAYAGSRSIATMNNPEHFSALWSGFTSGRVRLSITAELYEATTARFCLKSLKGVDLSVGTLEDSQGPAIQIDNPYGEAMPAAAVGCSYPVFSATAKDANTGSCPVKTTVWYNYTADNAVMVNVTDGQFRTDRVGNYAIVYEASDRLGNVTQQVLWVYAHETVKNPTVTLTEAAPTTLTLGQLLTPADYQTASYSGKAEITITATLDGTAVDIAQGDFRPEKAGTYTVTYTVTDYIGQTGTAAYQIEATPGDKPVFVDSPVFPEVLIAGCSYDLPELYANDYRSGSLERKQAAAEITDAQGSRSVDGSFIPQVTENGHTVTVVYTCDGASLEVTVPVILPWRTEEGSSRPKLCLENYLYGQALNFVKNDDSITVSATTADAGWVFANQMIAEGFELKFRGIAEASRFDGLYITLADGADPTVAVTVKILNRGTDKAQVVVGDQVGTVAAAFGLGSEFVVSYRGNTVYVGGTGFAVSEDNSGRAFQGFPSGRITAKMDFAGAGSGGAYDLISLCGYAMSNLTSDRTGPNIVVLGEYGGSYSIGQELTIPAALAADVLDANVIFHITVTDPAGQVVTALDGTKLSQADPTVSYTVKLDQYGQYNVRLVASDTFNGKANETILPYTVTVDDEEKPELTFIEEVVSAAKVGDILVLPAFTVTDNVTQQVIVQKYVYTPGGRLLPMTAEENAIKATAAGVYEFRIYVSDEAGNMTLIRKAVTVSESEGE